MKLSKGYSNLEKQFEERYENRLLNSSRLLQDHATNEVNRLNVELATNHGDEIQGLREDLRGAKVASNDMRASLKLKDEEINALQAKVTKLEKAAASASASASTPSSGGKSNAHCYSAGGGSAQVVAERKRKRGGTREFTSGSGLALP